MIFNFACDEQAHNQVEGGFRADGERHRAIFYPLRGVQQEAKIRRLLGRVATLFRDR